MVPGGSLVFGLLVYIEPSFMVRIPLRDPPYSPGQKSPKCSCEVVGSEYHPASLPLSDEASCSSTLLFFAENSNAVRVKKEADLDEDDVDSEREP